eukprot:CAMPEP_0202908160 /NCGR_PEP_ID=MMETSP1392-20130828/45095_1 /ASSEMBLY_ACC=CAM_ASM_000868 /TAXON_ID=225041 /ORGANISM="Chlamydomonas chlamydogama, Strain SAG 11-48b" /LENGTH=33 /DNA_ID= /DNA_START= /DNA_END= /DNA_ORIENTATION=
MVAVIMGVVGRMVAMVPVVVMPMLVVRVVVPMS